MRIKKREERKPLPVPDNTVAPKTAFYILAGLTVEVLHRKDTLKAYFSFGGHYASLCIKAVDDGRRQRRYLLSDVLCMRDCLYEINGSGFNTAYQAISTHDQFGSYAFGTYGACDTEDELKELVNYCRNSVSRILELYDYRVKGDKDGVLLLPIVRANGRPKLMKQEEHPLRQVMGYADSNRRVVLNTVDVSMGR